MGRYSKDEQTIIKQIIELGQNISCANPVLFNVYMPILNSNQVNVDDRGLYFDETHTQETIIEIEYNIARISLLIDDLIKNRLITLVKVGANLPFLYKVNNGTIYDKIDSNIFNILKQSFYSKVYISAELKELVSNDFKTYEEIQLEEAQNQTKIAHESLEEARKQTESANKSLEEARKQTKASLDSLAETIKQTQKTQESLEEAQKQSYQARTQTGLSILTLFLSVGAILWSIYASNEIPITINQSQFDSIQIQQKVLIETLNEIKMSQMDKDSVIKELDSTKAKIDKISNTLKELKKMNSKER